MNIIDSYRFGQIAINGKHYNSDVIISRIELAIAGGERQVISSALMG